LMVMDFPNNYGLKQLNERRRQWLEPGYT
jgi:hypothetical protein